MNKELLNIVKNVMSGLLPVHKVENIAPKIAERLEAEGVILPPCKVGDMAYNSKEEAEQALRKEDEGK